MPDPTHDLAALREAYGTTRHYEDYDPRVLAALAVVEAAQFLPAFDCPVCYSPWDGPSESHDDGCPFGALLDALRPFRVTT